MKHIHLSGAQITEMLRLGEIDKLTASQTTFHEELTEESSGQTCKECQQKISEFSEMFLAIKQTQLIAPENDLWEGIEQKKKIIADESKHRLRNWSFTSVAASFFLVAIFIWNGVQNDRILQNQIQATILHSQHLERELSNAKNILHTGNSSINYLTNNLYRVDEDLQRAYKENEEAQIILELWDKRVQLLIKISETATLHQNVEII